MRQGTSGDELNTAANCVYPAYSVREGLTESWVRKRREAREEAQRCIRRCRETSCYDTYELHIRYLGCAAYEHHVYNRLIWNRTRELKQWI